MKEQRIRGTFCSNDDDPALCNPLRSPDRLMQGKPLSMAELSLSEELEGSRRLCQWTQVSAGRMEDLGRLLAGRSSVLREPSQPPLPIPSLQPTSQ